MAPGTNLSFELERDTDKRGTHYKGANVLYRVRGAKQDGGVKRDTHKKSQIVQEPLNMIFFYD